MGYQDVLNFWFHEIEEDQWWESYATFDQLIRDKFFDVHSRATKCELFSWRATAHGRLAEIIVLDQFSRNMFRDSPQAYAHDPLALCLAQQAVTLGSDKELNENEKLFLYMPYMHSESLIIHEESLRLFTELGQKDQLIYERRYVDIIKRFGRFPHRNASLGRTSSEEEKQFLAEAFGATTPQSSLHG